MMLPQRLGGGDEACYTYDPEADDPDLRRGRLCQQSWRLIGKRNKLML